MGREFLCDRIKQRSQAGGKQSLATINTKGSHGGRAEKHGAIEKRRPGCDRRLSKGTARTGQWLGMTPEVAVAATAVFRSTE